MHPRRKSRKLEKSKWATSREVFLPKPLRNSPPGVELTKQTNDANYPEILSQRSVQVGLNHLNCFRWKSEESQ